LPYSLHEASPPETAASSEIARACLDYVVTEKRAHAAFEYEAVLVLARVQVQRRRKTARRHRMLDECESFVRVGAVDHEAHANAAEEPFLAISRTYNLHTCCCLHPCSFR
jgi:hypothetical protein